MIVVQFQVSNIMARISYILMRWCLLCSWPTYLAGFFYSAQRNESIRVDMSFYSLSPIPSQLLFLNAACLFEKQQIPILVWFWTQNLLHANHYTWNMIPYILMFYTSCFYFEKDLSDFYGLTITISPIYIIWTTNDRTNCSIVLNCF